MDLNIKNLVGSCLRQNMSNVRNTLSPSYRPYASQVLEAQKNGRGKIQAAANPVQWLDRKAAAQRNVVSFEVFIDAGYNFSAYYTPKRRTITVRHTICNKEVGAFCNGYFKVVFKKPICGRSGLPLLCNQALLIGNSKYFLLRNGSASGRPDPAKALNEIAAPR